MATELQKRAVEKLVENRGNVSKSMREAGYDDTTAKNPKNLTDSKGFEELCKNVGLTDDFVLQALHSDIVAKPKRRIQELNLAAEIRGLKKLKHELTGKDGAELYPTSSIHDALRLEYELKLKEQFLKDQK